MTTGLRSVRPRTLILILAAALVLGAGGVGLAGWRADRAARSASEASRPSPPLPMDIVEGRPIVLGPADARATVTVYTDFHCKACATVEQRFHDTLLTAERNGRVRLEIYPVAGADPGSAAASNALACAAEAGGAEGYYLGLLVDPQARRTDSNLVELGNNTPLAPGTDEGFENCVTSQQHLDWVGSINAAAATNGITAAPTLLLDGMPLDLTSLTPEILSGMIEEANR